MADFNELKAAIRAAIYENEDQAITGDALQEVLLEMVDEVNGEKQDVIADLDAIRAGAAMGDTAVQNVKSLGGQDLEGTGNIEVKLTTNAGTPNKLRLEFGADTISSQGFKTINGASLLGEGEIVIDTANLVRSTTIRNMVTLSQAEYDALADKDANTFYVII